MTRFHRLQLALALVAAVGTIVPPAAWAQGGSNESQALTPVPDEGESESGIIDVAMSEQGAFSGVLVDEQGNPIEAAAIKMYRGEEMVAELTTDVEGRFASQGLTASVYRVVSPQGEGTFRLWSHDAAPPTAITNAVLVNSSGVARAQLGILDPVGTSLILLGVTSVVLAAVSLGEVDSLQDDIDDLNDQLSP